VSWLSCAFFFFSCREGGEEEGVVLEEDRFPSFFRVPEIETEEEREET